MPKARRKTASERKADQAVAELADAADGAETDSRTSRALAERDMKIVQQYRRGVSTKSLASAHKVTPRRVEQIIRQWDDWEPEALSATARGRQREHINRLIQIADQLLEDAGLLFAKALASNNVSLQIGALRRRQEAAVFLATTQQAAGILPRNLGAPDELARTQELFRNLAEILRDPRVPDEILAQVLELAESRFARERAIDGRALPAAS